MFKSFYQRMRSQPYLTPERRFWVFAASLFAVLVLLVYFPIFSGQIPLPGGMVVQFPAWEELPHHDWSPVANIGDLIDYFYPFHRFSSDQIHNGTFPLWNPYVMSGYPFQAEPQSALFYPLHVFYYVFSTPTAWLLMLLVRVWLAAMFMTLLVRSIGGSKAGAIGAAIAFSFGGFMVAWQGAAVGDAMIWLPLMCYCVLRLQRDRDSFSTALTGFAFAMPVLAGHPETAIHVILAGCFAALWVCAPRFNAKFFLLFSLAGLLSIGLAFVQIVPTLEWVLQSGRDPNAIWPSFELHQGLGFFSRDILHNPNSAGIFVPNAVAYVGMVTLLLAAIGLLHPLKRYVVGLVLLIAVGIAGTHGIEPVRWILHHVPIIQGVKNERLILMADFGLAILAGMGITVLQEKWLVQSTARRAMAWIMTATGFAVVMVCVHKLQLATQFEVDVMRRPSFSRGLLLAGMVLIVWKLIRGSREKLFPVLACALLAFDLGTFAYGYSGWTPRNEVFPAAPVFDFLRQRDPPGTFRVAPIGGYPFASNSGISYGLEFVGGFEASVPVGLHNLIAGLAERYLPAFDFLADGIMAATDRRLDLLNLKYFVVVTSTNEYPLFVARPDRFTEVYKRGSVAVFENRTVMPRAFLVPAAGIRVVPDVDEPLPLLMDPAFDPHQTVAVYAQPAGLNPITQDATTAFEGQVEIVEKDTNSYRFRMRASTPAVLVVSQTFYPGWKATVDGGPSSVFPADQALTGIAVPAGVHDVWFVFDPVSFKLGLAISIISALILVAMVLRRIRI